MQKRKKSRSSWKDVFGEAMCRVVEFGKPNSDGLIVQRHQAESRSAIPVLIKDPLNRYDIKHSEISGMGKILFLGDGIYVSINAWPGQIGDLLRDSLAVGYNIIPVGTGGVDENGYVWDYRLLYFQASMPERKTRSRNPI